MCLVAQMPCGAKGRRRCRRCTKRRLMQPKSRPRSRGRVVVHDGCRRRREKMTTGAVNQVSLAPVSRIRMMRKNADSNRNGLWNRKSDHHRDPLLSPLGLRSRPETCSQKSPPLFTGRRSDMGHLRELKFLNRHVPLPPPSLPPNEFLPQSPSPVVNPYLHRPTSSPPA